jgi:hypothetical protein
MSGTSPGKGDSHPTHRHRVAVIAGFAVISLVFFGILTGQRSAAVTVPLPNGGSLKFLGISRGERVAAQGEGPWRVEDMDGYQWNHFLGPKPTWPQRAYQAAPAYLQKHLPGTWAPPDPDYPVGIGGQQMMLWLATGAFDTEKWRLTWVDENGFESTAYETYFTLSENNKPLAMTTAMPPCYSSKVVLRLREKVEEKPISQWPLLAEIRMRNPAPVPKTAQALNSLPATRTKDGVTVTLQSIIVDPAAVATNRAVEVRLRVTPRIGLNASVGFSDQRRMSMSMHLMSDYYEEDKEDSIIWTSRCFWSDAPWLVRVMLWPGFSSNQGLPPGLRSTLRFTGVPLPGRGPVVNPLDYKGAAGGVDLALHTFRPETDSGGPRWLLEIQRSKLPPQCVFHFVSVKDNLGRVIPWSSESTAGGGDGALHGLSLIVPEDSQAKSADIEMVVERPLIFDFYVMPEFKGMPKKAEGP